MSEIFRRVKAKLKEIYYELPLPNVIQKLKPKDPADGIERKHDEPDDVSEGEELPELPDDFRDIKLEKTNKVYHLQLKDIPPHQWMQVGTSLRNMAFKDPEYGHVIDEDAGELKQDPLPPPPEPTEYIKSLKKPLVSLYLKNLSWVELEEIGELFYDLGWNHRKEYDMDDYDGLPDEFNRCDDFPETEAEEVEREFFDPIKRVTEELTEVKRVTNSDVLPGLDRMPWKDAEETWTENPHPNSPPWEDPPEEDFVSRGKIFPMQSHVE